MENCERKWSDKIPEGQKWGPFISERAWGTVREDYSADGNAWDYLTHDDARYRAFRWGEDGIAGWCDRYQILNFAPAFWNGKDPFLKERLFGLSFWEGNHGEDVKEYYYHLDGTPDHSYMKYLYRYPHHPFPYDKLRQINKSRNTFEPEYELIDTDIFAENRFFDIYIEYAKASEEDTCIRIEAVNQGPEPASLHILPHLWFRNQWSWTQEILARPEISKKQQNGTLCLVADEKQMRPPSNLLTKYRLGKRYLYGPAKGVALFTNNETRNGDQDRFTKEAFHEAVVHGKKSVNPEEVGSKACFHYFYENIPSLGSIVLHLRFTNQQIQNPLESVEKTVKARKAEADAFYANLHPKKATEEEKAIQRQAIAGILWTKQFYYIDVNAWLKGDEAHIRPPKERHGIRNYHWKHLQSMRILSMPDKWEYPWFAAWDLAFHCLTIALADVSQAKEQLWLLLFEQFQHPNGQIPAYEWEFSDLNPPVHAWAILEVLKMEEKQKGKKDLNYLKQCFHKLLLNFSWWVNKIDSEGYNIFEGGFLGLDNITVVDRSSKAHGGERLEQSDGTGWMAFYCLNLMRIALELAKEDPSYEALATKFFQHFVYIRAAMKKRDDHPYNLWDEKDGFFYDVIRYPNRSFVKLRVRSLVGIIPVYATEIISKEELERFPQFATHFYWFLQNKSHLIEDCVITKKGNYILGLLNLNQLHKVLEYIWDPEEFRAKYGFRSLSKFHEKNPFIYEDKTVHYEPGESVFRIKGGNSNWRGPVWFPTSYLLIESLLKLHQAYGNDLLFKKNDETPVTAKDMACFFAEGMISIFKKDTENHRPYLGQKFPYKGDPKWMNHLLFYEHFNPDTGEGIGASHQTGWTALVANLIQKFRE